MLWFSLRNRTSLTLTVGCIGLMLLVAQTLAQTSEPAATAAPQEQIPIEVFKAPEPNKIEAPNCRNRVTLSPACEELYRGVEGWVELGFMVDAGGKPYEVTVIRSTGNKTFEKVAMDAIERSSFVAGSLNGKPIESGYEMKYKFAIDELPPGAGPQFVSAYKALMSAIDAGDRTAADTAMKRLKITNLYEDAYFGIANYGYARKWGDESQQLASVRRAIAEEDLPRYLPKEKFRAILLTCLQLELNTREYAEALTTWSRLEKAGVDKNTEARIRPFIERLQKLRTDDTAYQVSGLMPDGQWHLHLFKRHFQVLTSEGVISQVKLRCDRRYVFFEFDPRLEYHISKNDGNCSIELDGSPGTRFKLIQF